MNTNRKPPTPRPESSSTVVIAISADGESGFVALDSSGWAVIVAEQKQATQFTATNDNGVLQFTVASGSWEGYFLGTARLRKYDYVGAFSSIISGEAWNWTLAGGNLLSDNDLQKLSLYSSSDGYLYTDNDYIVLDVTINTISS